MDLFILDYFFFKNSHEGNTLSLHFQILLLTTWFWWVNGGAGKIEKNGELYQTYHRVLYYKKLWQIFSQVVFKIFCFCEQRNSCLISLVYIQYVGCGVMLSNFWISLITFYTTLSYNHRKLQQILYSNEKFCSDFNFQHKK